jgi:uncharacterized protein (DUF2147 family)
MRTAAITLASGMALFVLAGPAFAQDPAEGEWLTQDGAARVRIAPCTAHPDHLCGAVAWLKDPNTPDGQPRRDQHNPDAKLRSRPVVGLNILSGFHRESPGRWTGGSIYDPKSGKTYNSKLNVAGNGNLDVNGCVLMICKAQVWTRTH